LRFFYQSILLQFNNDSPKQNMGLCQHLMYYLTSMSDFLNGRSYW